MKITLDCQFRGGADVKEWLDEGNRIKFVLIKCKELIARLFTDSKHSSEAQRLMDEVVDEPIFMGAGDFRKDLNPEWDSDSCCNEFGYDKPKENSDQVMAEFKDALLKLIAEAPVKETPQPKLTENTQVRFVPGQLEDDPVLKILPPRSAEEQKKIDDWIEKVAKGEI